MNIYSLRARVSERPIVIALSADMRVYLYVCVCVRMCCPPDRRGLETCQESCEESWVGSMSDDMRFSGMGFDLMDKSKVL